MVRFRFFILAVNLLLACEYQPTGIYLKEIVPEIPSGLSISIKNFADTIKLYQDEQIEIDFSSLNRKLYKISASINGINLDVKIDESKESASLSIDNTDNLGSGNYALTMKVIVHSGSKSLLNELGGEFYELEYNVPVWIDLELPGSVDIKTTYLEDGYLNIEWEKYKRIDFSHYTIQRIISSQGIGYYSNTYIHDRDITHTADSFFLGANSTYQVFVNNNRGHHAAGEVYEVYDVYNPNIDFEILQEGNARISWDQTPFYGNFLKYHIGEMGNGVGEKYDVFEIENSSINTNKEILFGGHYHYRLDLIAKDNPYQDYEYYWEGYSIPLFHGKKANRYAPYSFYNLSSKTYFNMIRESDNNLQSISIVEFDLLSQEVLRRKKVLEGDNYTNLFLTENGEKLYILSSSAGKLYYLDPFDLEVNRTIDLNDFVGVQDAYFAQNFYVSNNDILSLYNTRDNSTYVVDLNNSKNRIKQSGKYTLSEDGRYLGGFRNIYTLNENFSISHKYTTLSTVNFFIINSKLNFVIIPGNSMVSCYSLDSGELMSNSYQGNIISYDKVMGLVLLNSNAFNQNIGIVDCNNQFEAVMEIPYTQTKKQLVNGYLVSEWNDFSTAIKIK